MKALCRSCGKGFNAANDAFCPRCGSRYNADESFDFDPAEHPVLCRMVRFSDSLSSFCATKKGQETLGKIGAIMIGVLLLLWKMICS